MAEKEHHRSTLQRELHQSLLWRVSVHSHLLHHVSRTLDLSHHRPCVGVLHPADQPEPQTLLLCVLVTGREELIRSFKLDVKQRLMWDIKTLIQ